MYCTLQEAWGDIDKSVKESFENPKKENYSNYKKISNPEAELYNSYNESIYGSNKKKTIDNNGERFDFSRGINRLPNSNGSKKRVNLPPINLNDDESYEINDNENDNENDNDNDYYDKDENEYIDDDNKISIISKLNQIIKQIDANKNINEGDGNNVNELLLYIITGVFLIFILDTFVRIGKRF